MKDESSTQAQAKVEVEHDRRQAPQDLRERTKCFALRVIRLYTSLPKTAEAQVIGKQILRSGTSVGAQYREGHRAKSNADVVNKFEGVLQELDETAYWLELLVESEMMRSNRIEPLLSETNELIAIFVTIVTRLKRKRT